MNIERILNMVIRQIMRRVINKGISKGMDVGSNALTKRRDTPETDQQPPRR